MMDLANLKNLILIPTILAYLWQWSKRPHWYLLFGAVLFLSCGTEIFAWFLKQSSINNLPVYNTYMAINTCLVCFLAGVIGKFQLKASIAASGIVLILFGYQFCWGDGIHAFASSLVVISGFIIAAYSGFALYRLAERAESNMLHDSRFWILSSFLFYYLCFAPSIGLVGFLMYSDPDTANTLLSLNDIFFIVHFGLIIFGISKIGVSRNSDWK